MKEITKSLVAFQNQLKPVAFDAKNPFFKSQYLTLSGLLDACLPVLTKNNLAVTQTMKVDGEKVILKSILIHVSGESIESEMILPQVNDPQKYGSLITYYKRYQLQALLGVSAAEEDDDGNSLSTQKPQQPQEQKPIPSARLASQAQINALKKIFPNSEIIWEKLTDTDARKMFDQKNGTKK
jgi:hypothetical protein